jgi:EAL domain-containing protein (putative c-di-GMP-specific phosphodiesterase class I)
MNTSPAAGAKQRAAEIPSGQDAQLIEYLERIDRFRAGRRAVHLHLSRLQPHNRRDHHLRIALNTFEDLVKQYDGQIFMLANQDLVFVAKDASTSELEVAVARIRTLFNEDPIAQDAGHDASQFSTWYNLETQHRELFAAVRKLASEALAKRRASTASAAEGAAAPERKRVPIDPIKLGKLEELLSRNDLSNLMRRQAICAVVPKSPPQSLFRELYISIADLQNTVVPDVDLFADQWLFQRLTQTLDRRMLALMTKNDDATLNAAFSLNLNVQTILSPEFLAFDKARASLRGNVVIEMQKIDIFADLGAFFFARDFLRERGYRVCLDGVNYLSLPFIDREQLGVDLLKVVWSAEMKGDQPGRGVDLVKSFVQRTGRSRVILSRIDNEEGVRYGHDLGITLFQGRYLDQLVGTKTGERPMAATPAASPYRQR